MRTTITVLLLLWGRCAFAAFNWEAGPWGVVVQSNGTPGSASCVMEYPGGVSTGNACAIHYQVTPTHLPQLWVFLTDGFWRQTSAESEFGTSYRVFRYFSSDSQDCDRATAVYMRILGTNEAGELRLETVYSNNAMVGDRFRITGTVVLEKPDALQTAMRADLLVSNASGRAVSPSWNGHLSLAEQWEFFGVSSMYVADNLSGEWPAWYDTQDPAHRYLGITNNADYLDDGYSIKGSKHVSTHDTKYVVISNATLALDHETNTCPYLGLTNYLWYTQLLLRAQFASEVRLQHAYRSSRNHRVELTECAGLTSALTDLRWSVTFNRWDTNMVDGDNVQVKLGMDDILSEWPVDGVQSVSLRLSTGNMRPAITSLTVAAAGQVSVGWTTEPGERYGLEHTAVLGGSWSNIAESIAGPMIVPLSAPTGFLRIVETNAP